jgi:hypothetical protein
LLKSLHRIKNGYIFVPTNKLKHKTMTTFKNRRDAILEISTLNSQIDLAIFMGRMVKTMKAKILSQLDCDMIADELQKNFKYIK